MPPGKPFPVLLLLLALLAALPVAAQQTSASGVEPPPTVLITGANRGLGLEWARQYAERDWTVIATARRPADAVELLAFAKSSRRVRIEVLDATDAASVNRLGERLRGVAIDVLVNNAGMIGEEDEQRLSTLDASKFDSYMRVNALSALLVTERLLPNLRAGRQKKVAGISARVASFAAYPRIHSGLYYYKASKTALNMILRNLALDLAGDGIAVVALSPGVVNTYGTETNHDAMSPEMRASMTDVRTSVAGMIKVLDELELGGSGRWYRYTGDVISW